MNYSTAIFIVNNEARAVRCEYEPGGGNPQNFKTLDASIKKDDMVVVPTSTRHGFTVVKVIETDVDVDLDAATEMKWVVAKVDKGRYDDLLAKEAAMIKTIKSAEVRKKREDMRAAIFKDQEETLKALPLAHYNGDAESTPSPAATE